MKASEFIFENKKRKRKPRGAAWGPGPYGMYGTAVGFSGAAGASDGGAVGEASYPGNLGMMELAKFFQSADDNQKKLLKQLLEKGKKGLAWKLIQDVTGVALQGKEFQTDEGWKDWVAGAALGAAAVGGGGAAWDAMKDKPVDKPAVVAKATKTADVPPNAVPKQSVTGTVHEKLLTKVAVAAGIKGTELAQFLGQVAHESGNFAHMKELGNDNYFKKYEPKFAKDKKTKKLVLDPKTKKPKNLNPKAVELGNTMPGDGAKYKGRGYIQLTGKYNYEQASKALGLDLVKNPELVEKPEIAAKVALWFWQNRVQPKVDNFNDTKASTKPINKGLKGLEDRKEKFHDFKVAMR